jgi:hypothetical protein
VQAFVLLYALGNSHGMNGQVPMKILRAQSRKKQIHQIKRSGSVKQQSGGLIHHQTAHSEI